MGTPAARQRALDAPALEAFRRDHPRLWHFATVRFARGEYLGLHLTLGFAVSLAALGLFGGIAEDVVHHDPLTQLDFTILHAFRAHATHAGDSIMGAVSLVGSPGMMVLLALVVSVLLAMQRRWLILTGGVVAFVGGAYSTGR